MNKKPLLTKLQRYTAYCIMLAEAETEGIELGLCHLSGKLFDLYPLESGYGRPARDKFGHVYETQVRVDTVYPEIWRKREIDGAYWFEDNDERIAALKQCIKETHP